MHWCKQHHGNIHSWTMSSPPWKFHMQGCHHSCAPYHGGGVGNGGPESCTHNMYIYIVLYYMYIYICIHSTYIITIYLHISIYYFRGMVAMLLFLLWVDKFLGAAKKATGMYDEGDSVGVLNCFRRWPGLKPLRILVAIRRLYYFDPRGSINKPKGERPNKYRPMTHVCPWVKGGECHGVGFETRPLAWYKWCKY